MKHTEKQAIEIAAEYKKKHPSLKNEIKKAHYNEKFDVEGQKAWIVIATYELFGEIKEFFYVISDSTGKVEYTFNEHGSRDPHIDNLEDKKLTEEWDKEWEELEND